MMEEIKQPLVSVILPTYNVAKYLLQCLNSIKAQTYKRYECIIIIDGATDGSYEIAQTFCATDERFHVHWQQNAGSGPARNNGLEHSKGELVMFIDPDDWCASNYIENLVEEQQKKDYDLVCSKQIIVHFDKKGKEQSRSTFQQFSIEYTDQNELRRKYLYLQSKGYLTAPHGKIYKRSIIEQCKIRFPDLRRSQDIVFNYRYFDCIKTLYITSFSGYFYRVMYKDRALRYNKDYYKTVVFLYNEIESLHCKWNIDTNIKGHRIQLFNGGIYPCIESCVIRGESFKDMLNDLDVQKIIAAAEPHQFRFTIIKALLLHKCYYISWLFIKLMVLLKMLYSKQ